MRFVIDNELPSDYANEKIDSYRQENNLKCFNSIDRTNFGGKISIKSGILKYLFFYLCICEWNRNPIVVP